VQNYVQPIVRYINRTPTPPLIYGTDTVRSVCDLLHIDVNDAFCGDLNNQRPIDLEEALYRNFPPQITTFADLMSVLGGLRSKVDGSDFWAQGCVPTSQPEFTCSFVFPSEVRTVKVYFDDKNVVTNYLVTNAHGGTE
jgi:hypothetical protein